MNKIGHNSNNCPSTPAVSPHTTSILLAWKWPTMTFIQQFHSYGYDFDQRKNVNSYGTFPSAMRVYNLWRWYLFCRSIATPCIIAHWRKRRTPFWKAFRFRMVHNIWLCIYENDHYLLLNAIWLTSDLPCETDKGHSHGTVMMIKPPASTSAQRYKSHLQPTRGYVDKIIRVARDKFTSYQFLLDNKNKLPLQSHNNNHSISLSNTRHLTL